MNFHFLRPEWFWSLILMVVVLWFIRHRHQKQSQWHQWIAPHLKQALVVNETQHSKNALWPVALTWLMAVFALAGPSWQQTQTPMIEHKAGRVIVLDLSLSMYANDVKPNRITQAKYKLNDLLHEINEGETGLVVYAGDAFMIAPLTADHATLLNFIPALEPSLMPVAGSNATIAMEKAVTLLSRSQYSSGDIIWITDGFDGHAYDDLLEQIPDQTRLYVYAVGTKEGAPVQTEQGTMLKDSAGNIVISKTNFADLKRLAEAKGGKLFVAQSFNNESLELAQALNERAKANVESDVEEGLVWEDMGVYFAFALLIPLLLAFRQGHMLMLSGLMLGGAALHTPKAHASLFQNQQQQAVRAYQDQDFKTAAELGDHDQKLQASALYRNGEFDASMQLWAQIDSPEARYNQGNALMNLQKYQEAADMYQQALNQKPYFPEAEHNLKLAQKMAQEQDQEKKEQEPKPEDQKQTQNQDSEPESKQADNNASEPDSNQEAKQDQTASNDNNEPEQPKEPETAEHQANESKSQDPEQDPQTAQAEQEDTAQNADNQSEPVEQAAQTANNSTDQQALPAHLKRIMQQVPDNPSLLLRNKMKIEYLKRQQQGQEIKEQNPW
jgi:Ca-activated chloride channel family protein